MNRKIIWTAYWFVIAAMAIGVILAVLRALRIFPGYAPWWLYAMPFVAALGIGAAVLIRDQR